MTSPIAVADRKGHASTASAAVRPRHRRVALARSLVPALLPAFGHLAHAQADAVASEPAGSDAPPAASADAAAVPAGREPGLFGLAGPGLLATPSGRTFRLVKRASLTETLTDNVTLSSTNRRADLVTQASVGAQFLSTAGRLRGFADYSLTANHYARGTASTTLLNGLSAAVTGELIERRAFVDVSAAISQQSISLFGTQSPDTALANANRAEVRTYRVSPYVRGLVPAVATYELRATYGATHVSGATAGDFNYASASALLTSVRGGRFGWSATALHDEFHDASGRTRVSDRVNGALHFTPLPELRLSALGGREANNFVTLDRRTRNTYGARLNWTPTPRTNILAERQQGFFGETHAYTLAHRMPRSAVVLSDVKGAFVGGLQGDASRAALLTLFDLQFTRLESDPNRRRLLVEDFLRLNPGAARPFALLTSSTVQQRSQVASYTYFGLRDALTVFASRTSTERIDTLPTIAAGDLATFARVRQQGFGATLNHRLTPVSTVSGSLSQQRTSGDAATGRSGEAARLQSASLTWSTRLGPGAFASVSARHSRFEGRATSYRESALIGNINLRF